MCACAATGSAATLGQISLVLCARLSLLASALPPRLQSLTQITTLPTCWLDSGFYLKRELKLPLCLIMMLVRLDWKGLCRLKATKIEIIKKVFNHNFLANSLKKKPM